MHTLTRKFVLLTLTACAFVTTAMSQNPGKKMIVAGNADTVSIGAELNVLLVMERSNESSLYISEEAEAIVKVQVSAKAIRVQCKFPQPPKDTVYLYLRHLCKLVLGEKATVHTRGIITTPQLQLFLGAESKAHLKTSGKIIAHSLSDVDLSVEPSSSKAPVEIRS